MVNVAEASDELPVGLAGGVASRIWSAEEGKEANRGPQPRAWYVRRSREPSEAETSTRGWR